MISNSIGLQFQAGRYKMPAQQQALPIACYFKVTLHAMTNEEILQAVRQVKGLGGMTVNERLYVSGLMNEFGKPSIDKILN